MLGAGDSTTQPRSWRNTTAGDEGQNLTIPPPTCPCLQARTCCAWVWAAVAVSPCQGWPPSSRACRRSRSRSARATRRWVQQRGGGQGGQSRQQARGWSRGGAGRSSRWANQGSRQVGAARGGRQVGQAGALVKQRCPPPLSPSSSPCTSLPSSPAYPSPPSPPPSPPLLLPLLLLPPPSPISSPVAHRPPLPSPPPHSAP